MDNFTSKIEIIGINPFVFVPEQILEKIFEQAEKNKGHIPICGEVNGKPYLQTLLKYKGNWRLYINTKMLKNSPKRIGEEIYVTIKFDPIERILKIHPKLEFALKENKIAKDVFDKLNPSTRKEIIRYISFLKSEESIEINVEKAIGFLMCKNKFIGRSKP